MSIVEYTCTMVAKEKKNATTLSPQLCFMSFRYIYTCFQKGFHIERYIDRYIVLFCCTCARAHFFLVIVQLVKKLGSTINSLFVRFFVPICQ